MPQSNLHNNELLTLTNLLDGNVASAFVVVPVTNDDVDDDDDDDEFGNGSEDGEKSVNWLNVGIAVLAIIYGFYQGWFDPLLNFIMDVVSFFMDCFGFGSKPLPGASYA
mmetsp:Transcript_18647/g.33384  ORF Transcript_18647/g.33384 Transcript_18647/m.33384 type:complete len:109 (-) Transcript_18647:66-392(-)